MTRKDGDNIGAFEDLISVAYAIYMHFNELNIAF